MNTAEQWKQLLYNLNCVQDNQITSPPGYTLALNFVDSLSSFNYYGVETSPSVTLTIVGEFVNIEDGATQTYLYFAQLLSVALTATTP
jgi:hypothetical protein